MLPWIALAFMLAAAGMLYVKRRELARMQALIFGGGIVPGCIVAEAIVLVVLAAGVFVALRRN